MLRQLDFKNEEALYVKKNNFTDSTSPFTKEPLFRNRSIYDMGHRTKKL